MRFDLHIHTTYSDGEYTPQQVVDMAADAGLGGIAITDHDACRGISDIADSRGLTVLAGIEISATYGGEVHVLGLGIDPRSDAVLAHVSKAEKQRHSRAVRIMDMLRASGVDMTLEDVEKASGAGVIGRPHFAAVLVAKGYASSPKEAFSRYLGRHAPFFVPLARVSVRQAADIIANAGGKAVLAHPGLMSGSVCDALVPQLKTLGFWGIEAYHPAHTDGQCRAFESMARSHGLYVTAGSDFHGSVKPGVAIGDERRGGGYLKRSLDVLLAGMRDMLK